MPFINVTVEELESLASHIKSASANLNQEQSALLSKIASIAPGWEGSAGAQFDALYGQWRTSQHQLLEAMDRIASLLHQASENYKSTEASIASSFAIDTDAPGDSADH